MVWFSGYWIVESKEEWEKMVKRGEIQLNPKRLSFCFEYINGYDLPTSFPVAYKRHYLGSSYDAGIWRLVNFDEAVKDLNSIILEYISHYMEKYKKIQSMLS